MGADLIFLKRRIINAVALLLSAAAAVLGLAALGWILWTTLSKGIAAFNVALFTQMTPPPGEAGGPAVRNLPAVRAASFSGVAIVGCSS